MAARRQPRFAAPVGTASASWSGGFQRDLASVSESAGGLADFAAIPPVSCARRPRATSWALGIRANAVLISWGW